MDHCQLGKSWRDDPNESFYNNYCRQIITALHVQSSRSHRQNSLKKEAKTVKKKKKKINNNREKKKREKRSTGDTEKRIYTHTYIQYTHTYTHTHSCLVLYSFFILHRSLKDRRWTHCLEEIFSLRGRNLSLEMDLTIDRVQRERNRSIPKAFPSPPPHPFIMTTNLFREKFRVPRAMIAYVRQRRAIKP